MNQKPAFASCIAAAGLAMFLAGCESLSGVVQETSGDVVEDPVSRARVVAELKEARRLGLIPHGEQDIPDMTAEQIKLVAQAGERADVNSALARK